MELRRRFLMARRDSPVADQIREGIHSGRFVPGQRLIEADLTQEFSVSRSKLREAFRRLEADRLIEIRKNRGAAVRGISRKEVVDTLVVLGAVALTIVETVAQRAPARTVRRQIKHSLQVARRFRQRIGELDEARAYMNENARFWDVLTELCDNPVLAETRIRLETTLFRLVLEGSRISARKDRWIVRHEEILRAILDGRRAQIRKLVAESVKEVRDAILALPDNAFAA
jgi:DNA-binding GntR family transcriptional regulator